MNSQILERTSSLGSELAPVIHFVKSLMEDKSIETGAHKQFQCSISGLHEELVTIDGIVVGIQRLVEKEGDAFVSEALSTSEANKFQLNLKAIHEKISDARKCCEECRKTFETKKGDPLIFKWISFCKVRLCDPIDNRRQDLKQLRKAIFKVQSAMRAQSSTTVSWSPIENTEACITFLESAFRNKPFQVSAAGLADLSNDLEKDFLRYNSSETELNLLRQHFETFGQRWAASQFTLTPNDSKRTERAKEIHLSLANYLQSALMSVMSVPVSDPSSSLASQAEIVSERLTKWRNQNETSKLVIAIGGHFSHGKSSVINAIVGFPILPAMEIFTTALPCRIIHDPSAEEPSLEIPNLEPFQNAFAKLEAHQVKSEDKAELLDRNRDRPLKDVVSEALGVFRDHEFPKIDRVSGEEKIVQQLHHFNTLIRICHRLRIPFQADDPGIWPRVTTRLALLEGQHLHTKVKIELLDLPGFNDSLDNGNGNAEAFANIMRNAAKEATSIIPVVEYAESFKIVKDSLIEKSDKINDIWSRILRQKPWMERISLVLVTKVKDTNTGDREQLQRKVSCFTWDCGTFTERVILCDSLLAMAALHLEYEIQKETQSSVISERIANSQDVLYPLEPYLPSVPSLFNCRTILREAQGISGVFDLRNALTDHLYGLALHRNLKAFHADLGLWIRTIISLLCQPLSDARLNGTKFRLSQKEVQQEVKMIRGYISRWEELTSEIKDALEIDLTTKYKAFAAEVDQAWDAFAKEFQWLYSSTSSSNRNFIVNDRLESLAGKLYVQQRPFIDDIIELAKEGGKRVQKTIKEEVISKIKDDTQRQLMENSINTYGISEQVLIGEVEKALKGTASENRFTKAEILKALDHWLPRGQIGRRLQPPRFPSSDVSSLTSSMRLLDENPQPSEQIPLSPDDEANNISAIGATTDAARSSGFMYGEEGCSPSQLADAFMQTERETRRRDPASAAERILTSLRSGYIERYLATISEEASKTVTSQINGTARACLDDLEKHAMGREKYFEERQRRNGTGAETRQKQTLAEMLAWGNLVAGMKAMEVLETELKAITTI